MYMEKDNKITKNMFFECFFFTLCTKTLKRLKIIPYGEKKGIYEKRILCMF